MEKSVLDVNTQFGLNKCRKLMDCKVFVWTKKKKQIFYFEYFQLLKFICIIYLNFLLIFFSFLSCFNNFKSIFFIRHWHLLIPPENYFNPQLIRIRYELYFLLLAFFRVSYHFIVEMNTIEIETLRKKWTFDIWLVLMQIYVFIHSMIPISWFQRIYLERIWAVK